jgi:DNA-binding MarR family transcriptional regulator
MAIRRHPGVDQRGLARLIAFDRSTTGTVVEHLERRGLITRRTSRRDRRNKELFLSPAGAALLRKAHPIAWEIQDRLLQPLKKRERETFVRLLKTLVDANNDLSRAPLDPTAGAR